jgi:hypothetical protein
MIDPDRVLHRKSHRVTPPLTPGFYRRPPKPPLLDRLAVCAEQYRLFDWTLTAFIAVGIGIAAWMVIRGILFGFAATEGWRP